MWLSLTSCVHRRTGGLGPWALTECDLWHDDGGGDVGNVTLAGPARRGPTWTGASDSNGDFREREGVDVQG